MHEVENSANTWFNKDRSESASFRMPNKIFNNINVINPGIGLNIYENAISEEKCNSYINILESKLNGQTRYYWKEATVTNSTTPIKSARNCSDFKYKNTDLGPTNNENVELVGMHQDIYNIVKSCVDDYASYWGINVVFYEAFNFVKYDGPGQQFKIHADHGPAYNATVSVVVYLNENYQGGELYFPRLDNLVYKPKIGDIAIFPSNYIYEHASRDMIDGIKYSVVIMTDINTKGH